MRDAEQRCGVAFGRRAYERPGINHSCGDDAVERRSKGGILYQGLEPRDGRRRHGHFRLGDLGVRVAACDAGLGDLHLGHGDFAFAFGLVKLLLRNGVSYAQRLLAFHGDRLQVELGLVSLNLGPGDCDHGLGLLHLGPPGLEHGLGLAQLVAHFRHVDDQERVACRDVVADVHLDLGDIATCLRVQVGHLAGQQGRRHAKASRQGPLLWRGHLHVHGLAHRGIVARSLGDGPVARPRRDHVVNHQDRQDSNDNCHRSGRKRLAVHG